jgi:hypothetical protein
MNGPGSETTAGSESYVNARLRAAQAATAMISVLRRLIPVAKRLVGVVRVLSIMAAVSAAVIVVCLIAIARDVPRTLASVLLGLVLVGLLLMPAVILRLFYKALREVLAMPDWLRLSPEIVRDHGAELSALVRDVAGEPGSESSDMKRRAFREVPRAGKLLLEAHRDLPEYGSALRVVNPAFLFSVLVSLGATVFLVLSALFLTMVTLVLQVI